MINPINVLNTSFFNLKKTKNDVSLSNNVHGNYISNPVIGINEKPNLEIKSEGKVTRISFKGQLQDPSIPAIQFKVRGVTHHQKNKNPNGAKVLQKDRNVDDLADSNWKDGRILNYRVRTFGNTTKILIIDPQFGELGRVPDSIAPTLIKLLEKSPDDFQFQLSNVIAGTTKGASTTGLRVNLLYKGKDEKIKRKALHTFDYLLNSDVQDIKDNVMMYQPQASPYDVLQRIFESVGSKKDVQKILDTITKEINDPANKNILILGHCVPDGDTIGCSLGMQAAIKAAYPDRHVRVFIDDDIPGAYRKRLPGIQEIKRPFDETRYNELQQKISEIKSQTQTYAGKQQLKVYKRELSALKHNMLKHEDPVDSYDLVLLMEIPSPSRFSSAFKEDLENAKKVIYIDHHPDRPGEWQLAKNQTGVDMEKIRKANMAFVVPAVPAAAEMITIIADEANILNKTLSHPKYSKQFVAGIVSGICSDTGGFTRSANFTPEDIQKPVRQRPNFSPEGLSKWLIERLSGTIDKKWIRENIVYDISEKQTSVMEASPREKMIQYALDGQKIYAPVGLGVINISYDEMYDIWSLQKEFDPKATFADVQNAFKYSEVMGSLREAPNKATEKAKISPYHSPFENDKISVLLIQDKEKGKIDNKGENADCNGIRMSFRSKEGSIYAELLASLFNGGGHSSAAGARIDLDGVTLNSNIAIKLDGKTEYNAEQLYNALMENYEIKKGKTSNQLSSSKTLHSFETVLDSNGVPVSELLKDVTTIIRRNLNES